LSLTKSETVGEWSDQSQTRAPRDKLRGQYRLADQCRDRRDSYPNNNPYGRRRNPHGLDPNQPRRWRFHQPTDQQEIVHGPISPSNRASLRLRLIIHIMLQRALPH